MMLKAGIEVISTWIQRAKVGCRHEAACDRQKGGGNGSRANVRIATESEGKAALMVRLKIMCEGVSVGVSEYARRGLAARATRLGDGDSVHMSCLHYGVALT